MTNPIFWLGVPLAVGIIISVVLVRVLGYKPHRTILLDIAQGILSGAGLAFTTLLLILPNIYVTKVNGWTTVFGCGEPGNGVFLRAACGVTFLGPINVPQEAMYWTTKVDGAAVRSQERTTTSCTSRPAVSRQTMRSGR
jgi:hypothetical protein